MKRMALLGATGFVGSNLMDQYEISHPYNSRTVAAIQGEHFDEIICAAAPGVKWKANADPETDKAAVTQLIGTLKNVTTDRFTLISTIDVYDRTNGQDDESRLIHQHQLHPYGKHRYELETWVRERFPNSLIVRLPALFGAHLKKNALFDLMHNHQTHKLNPSAIFQWYPLNRLSSDIERARKAQISLINLFSEPLPLVEIVRAFFPTRVIGDGVQSAPTYDIQTLHSSTYEGPPRYIMSREAVMAEIETFLNQSTSRS